MGKTDDQDTKLLNVASELCERGFHGKCRDEWCECGCHLDHDLGGEG
jgi:hypothetical protein